MRYTTRLTRRRLLLAGTISGMSARRTIQTNGANSVINLLKLDKKRKSNAMVIIARLVHLRCH